MFEMRTDWTDLNIFNFMNSSASQTPAGIRFEDVFIYFFREISPSGN